MEGECAFKLRCLNVVRACRGPIPFCVLRKICFRVWACRGPFPINVEVEQPPGFAKLEAVVPVGGVEPLVPQGGSWMHFGCLLGACCGCLL